MVYLQNIGLEISGNESTERGVGEFSPDLLWGSGNIGGGRAAGEMVSTMFTAFSTQAVS